MHTVQTLTPAAVLERAAAALEVEEVIWGRGWFCEDGKRCVLGVIAWVVDPADTDGDPLRVGDPGSTVRQLAVAAVELFADHLRTEGLSGAACDCGCGTVDPVETAGGFNDDERTSRAHVIGELRAAAATR